MHNGPMLRPRYPILTERLALRPFENNDLDVLYDLYRRDEVTRYIYAPSASRQDAKVLLDRIRPMVAIDDKRGSLRLAGVERGTNTLIGDFSLWLGPREHRGAEIGFVVHPDHQRRGYAREAMTMIIGLAFRELGLHRIIGRCDARNTASASLMERLGMRREAHLVENEFIKGEWCDGLDYAILEREWARRSDAGPASARAIG
jgi:RimJ/RimL family protein N-acetyltransferase